ncbi:MAG: hypothetical protein JO166_07800 [Deltaproteobacteria bacterium]|nr:hypothetical protein [Deltaproteobacteria bacterium]
MKVLAFDLGTISGAAAASAPLLTWLAVNWLANPQRLQPPLPVPRAKPWLEAARRLRRLGGSLPLWAIACGLTVITLHHMTSDVAARVGSYRTGIATFVLLILAAMIAMRRRIANGLRLARLHRTRFDGEHDAIRLVLPLSRSVRTSPSIRPKTWQRLHIALAIGAMLPLWWHCDIARASRADLALKVMVILLVSSGFCAIATSELMAHQPSAARLIRGLFVVHRKLALLAFLLITIHVLAVLYFAGI